MNQTETQIYNEAMMLPDESKLLLIEKLLESVQSAIDFDIEKQQRMEAKRRRDEIRSGKVQPVNGVDALKKVRELIEK